MFQRERNNKKKPFLGYAQGHTGHADKREVVKAQRGADLPGKVQQEHTWKVGKQYIPLVNKEIRNPPVQFMS